MVLHQKASLNGMSRTWEASFNVEATRNKPAALSQIEYLEQKLGQLENEIRSLENKQSLTSDQIRNLYFQKGKLYSEIELLKRVPQYD